MTRRSGRIPSLALAALLTGALACAPARTDSNGEPRPDRAPSGANVVTAATLAQVSGSLLSAMMQELTMIDVEIGPGCPRIALRGPVVGGSFSNPAVYVDGTRTTNTCVLTSLDTDDVDRVEVYASGHTDRPGYANHPRGLILVFMRGG